VHLPLENQQQREFGGQSVSKKRNRNRLHILSKRNNLALVTLMTIAASKGAVTLMDQSEASLNPPFLRDLVLSSDEIFLAFLEKEMVIISLVVISGRRQTWES
jgi:hypothetical protein